MELSWIFPLFCLIFMIGMLFMMFRFGGCMSMRRGRPAGPGDQRESPRQILDRRYASGEIGREHYEELKRTLQAPGETR